MVHQESGSPPGPEGCGQQGFIAHCRQPQGWPCWATQGLFSSFLVTVTKSKGSRRAQKQRGADRQESSPQGCLKEGSLSCLPPSHSARPSPSHQSISWTRQQGEEDPKLFCLPLFLLRYLPETFTGRKRGS